jgi:hypothetical protein
MVWGLLARVLMVLSMLLKGTINVANRDVSWYVGMRGV